MIRHLSKFQASAALNVGPVRFTKLKATGTCTDRVHLARACKQNSCVPSLDEVVLQGDPVQFRLHGLALQVFDHDSPSLAKLIHTAPAPGLELI